LDIEGDPRFDGQNEDNLRCQRKRRLSCQNEDNILLYILLHIGKSKTEQV
jgi:hypothetical protein